MLNIDLVSDLHIDQWDSSIPNKYPCGKIKDFPIDWSKIKEKNNMLVVAGDISDNLDLDLKQSCKLELNMGELTEKTILDSSGNSNKGLLIGDYKIKKVRKGEPMRRDSFIKVATKINNRRGAL